MARKTKMQKLFKHALGVLGFVAMAATPTYAVTDAVYIQDLPEYVNQQDFKLHYTAISDGTVNAKFFYKKDGDAGFTEFASVSGYNGEATVSGSIVNEQKKYFFKVEINGGTSSDETSTFYDASGPSPVSEYVKEKIADGYYRLRWKNPGDSDFSRVFIYRSENPQFTADGSTKVGEQGGAPDSLQSWDNPGLDTTKTYYYALRAVDKAGNPSSVVADPDTSVQVLGVAAEASSSTSESNVTSLPKEGEVLAGEDKKEEGDQDDATASQGDENVGFLNTLKSLGYPKLVVIALIVLGLGALLMGYLKKVKED